MSAHGEGLPFPGVARNGTRGAVYELSRPRAP